MNVYILRNTDPLIYMGDVRCIIILQRREWWCKTRT